MATPKARGAASPSDAPAKLAAALASPPPATHTPAGLTSPEGAGSTTPFTDAAAWPVDHRLSVTQRVAVLNRRYPSGVEVDGQTNMVHAASSATLFAPGVADASAVLQQLGLSAASVRFKHLYPRFSFEPCLDNRICNTVRNAGFAQKS